MLNILKKIVKNLLPPVIFNFLKFFVSIFKKSSKSDSENIGSKLQESSKIDSNSVLLRKKIFGKLNSDKEFYVITGFRAGMFSTLQYVIAHIRQAELMGMIPVVDFENFQTAYSSGKPVNNERNTWLWFFKSVSPYSLDVVYRSKNVFFNSGDYSWDMGYYFSNHNFFSIYKKHIKFQDNILQLVKQYKKDLGFSKKRILGVQFRGWEMNTAPGHPFCPTIKQMLTYTDEILNKYQIDNIYLATEQQEYHDAFVAKYGDKVLFTPYYMTKKGINAYTIIPEPRENHLYHCGIEIIINAFLLSECTGLLHCGTNVSTFAKFINNGKYEFEYFVNNGVNSNNPFLAKYMYGIRKCLPKALGGLKNEVVIKTRED